MSDTKQPAESIFSKLLKAGEAVLEAQIYKAQNLVKSRAEEEFNFGKAVTKDSNYYIGAQGYYEKTTAISYEYLKQMAIKNSVVSAIIRTRQNRVAAFSDVSDGGELGFRIVLKDEEHSIEKLKSDLQAAKKEFSEEELERFGQIDPESHDFERELRSLLKKKTQKTRHAVEQFIRNCGEVENRPFESKKWNFDSFLRAIVWDTLTYDQIAVERVLKEAEKVEGRVNIHHFYPIDASTIRFASPELSKLNGQQLQGSYDILYPEDELKFLSEKTDALTLDPEKLENFEYRFVQVVRGKIERAFSEDQLVIGVRNQLTDLYLQGYGLSELETLVSLVASHLNTEFYNKAYFQQGFSAKGILHIKQNLNRSKLEELRRHWQHLVSGNRNSFQTPIMSGMDEVKWIPLTQNHSEMEFSLWLNYLIKMICAVYQIDPMEIGYGMKDEGGRGGGIGGGDSAAEKLQQSKDKGFVPLMRFIEQFINANIIEHLNPEFKFEWVGLDEKSQKESVGIEQQEVKFKRTVNELREKDGLRPIPGADDLILDPTYFQWFSQFHPEGKKSSAEQQQQTYASQQPDFSEQEASEGSEMEKALKIEYYRIGK
jgi:hypothetical protein